MSVDDGLKSLVKERYGRAAQAAQDAPHAEEAQDAQAAQAAAIQFTDTAGGGLVR